MKKQQQLNRHLTNRIIKPLIILLLLALFIIAGAYWILGAREPQTTKSGVVVEPTVSYVTEPTTIEEGCRNTALGIEFTYVPEGWECGSKKDSEGYNIIFLKKDDIVLTVKEGPYGSYLCTVPEIPYAHCEIENFFSNDFLEVKLYTYTSERPVIVKNKGMTATIINGKQLGITFTKGGSATNLYLDKEQNLEIKQILNSLQFAE